GDGGYLGPRRHDLPYERVGEVDDALDQGPFLRLEDPFLLADVEIGANLLLARLGTFAPGSEALADPPQQQVRRLGQRQERVVDEPGRGERRPEGALRVHEDQGARQELLDEEREDDRDGDESDEEWMSEPQLGGELRR